MSDDSRHDRERPVATPSQTVGPFFNFGLTTNAALGRMVDAEAPGEHVRIAVRVVDGAGAAVPDAMVELTQATTDAGLFGRLPTDATGSCVFETVRPQRTTSNGTEAAHINVCLLMRGLMRHLYTRIYFAGDADLASDPVLALVAGERRHTLIAQPGDRPGTWVFEVRLQGDGETVFFDL